MCICGQAMAQNVLIKGQIIDGDEGALPAATAMLMNSSDSVLVNFVLSDLEGVFEFKKILKGDYYVQLTYLQYDMIRVPVKVDGSKEVIDLGRVIMTAEGTRLEDVEITAELIPVLIKGDTIEYNAKAFKTDPADNVEQLLKQLPGIEVDQDGNIKAQGEDVEKILVDGKEFFGDDPKTASKNLPADAVDKVQVFDKMSDVSEFTGIDDGERTKTINLALKDDRKSGYFGNVEGGYGTKDRFEGKTNLNKFGPKTQISLLGMANNINKQAFGVQDYINFMGGVSNLMSQGGFGRGGGGGGGGSLSPSDLGVSMWGSGNGLNNNGIATTAAGGLNFNTDIGKNVELASSYFYNYLNNDIDKNSIRETVNEGLPFITNQDNLRDDNNHNHRVNLYVKAKVDSLSELIFRGSGRFNDAQGTENTVLLNLNDTIPQSATDQEYASFGGLLNTNNQLQYRRKLGRPGRTLSIQGNLIVQNDQNDLDLISQNTFWAAGIPFLDTLNQTQFQDVNSLTYGGRLTYTEPLGKGYFLQANYRHTENKYDLDKQFFDIVEEDPIFNTRLSNIYESIYRFDRAGVTLQKNRKKYDLSVGLEGQRGLLEGELVLADTTIRKEFLNLLPSLRFNYEFRKGRRMRLRYEPSVNEPSITQLQPVPDNSNPLNVYQGNPDLRAEYRHNLRLNYMLFDQFSFTSLFTMLRATYTQNKISNSVVRDSLFRQITQPVNVSQDLNLMTYIGFSTPIRKLKIKTNLNGNVTYTRGITFLDTVDDIRNFEIAVPTENVTNRLTSYADLSLENRKKEVLDARIGTRLTHNITKYSVNSEFDQDYLNATYYADVTVDFLKTWSINTNFNYNTYIGGSFDNVEPIPLLGASLSKRFLQGEKAQLKLTAFDILNKNIGINRTTNVNYFQEDRILTLNRYYMLTFSYSIVSMGKKSRKSKRSEDATTPKEDK